MSTILESLFRSDYMPHGHCYMWKPEILWLNVVSDLLIATAYFSIPFALYYFVKKRQDLEFKGIFILFSMFILLCGITHLIGIFVIWQGMYGIHGLAKFATALVSCFTAFKVFQVMPQALQIPTPGEMKAAYEKISAEKVERFKVEATRQQEVLLRESTDSAHVGIFVLNIKGVIKVANDAACKIFGFKKHELEGQNIDRLLQSSSVTTRPASIQDYFTYDKHDQMISTKRLVTGNTKQSNQIPLEIRLTQRIYEGQSVIFASFIDVTQREKAEKARKSSEQLTRNIIESLPLGLHVFTLKQDQLVLENYNQAAVRLLGLEHFSLVGKSLDSVFPWAKDTEIPSILTRIAKVGGTWVNESLHFRDEKISGVFEVTAFQSDANTAIVLYEDVTDKFESEQAVKAKDFFIESAFNASITGVYIFNTQTKQYEYINERFTQITGYSREELNQASENLLIDRSHEEDRTSVSRHLEYLLNPNRKNTVHKIEYRLKNKHQQWIWLMLQDVSLERDEQGEVIRYVGSFLEVTDLKQMQQHLVELKESAERANDAKSEFLANMSHEIRTPMNAILGLTHLVLNMELGDKQYEYLSKVESSSKSLLNILNDILDYSKMEAGKLELDEDVFIMEELIENSVGLFGLIAEDKHLEMVVEMSPSLSQRYIGDQLRLNQILNNLIGNALKFTESGHIKVSVQESLIKHKNTVQFYVEDSGIGMSPEQCEHLFDSFTQADSSIIRKYGGTGLGLSICKSLAILMGGDLTINSKLGVGSVFCLSVPIEPAEYINISDELTITPLRTLIVDDNEPSRIAIKGLFEEWGFNVTACDDGESALAAIKLAREQSEPFELMIVDWKMPQMSGLELIETVQSQFESQKPIVLMVTAYGKQYAERHARGVEVSAFLDKPILNSKVREMIFSLQNGQPQRIGSKGTVSESVLIAKPFADKNALVVEDNYTNQLVAKEFLNQLGFSVTIANNGEQAVELFTNASFDIILMDLQMPVMDGYTATKLIRRSKRGKGIPIFALSAAVMHNEMEKVKKCGMTGHIAKPIDVRKLLGTLANALDVDLTEVNTLINNDHIVDSEEIKMLATLGFNVKRALKNLDYNHQLYFQLLDSFVVDFKNSADKFNQYLSENDTQKIQAAAHTIAGLAGTLGSEKLRNEAKIVENAVENNFDIVIEPLLSQLTSDLNKIEKVLASYATETSRAQNAAAPYTNIITNLEDLRDKLEKHQFISPNELSHATTLCDKVIDKAQFANLCQAISKLDYVYAIQIIDSIKAKTSS